MITYICDGKKCEHCSSECTHTTDINHAVNFRKVADDTYEEVDSRNTIDLKNRIITVTVSDGYTVDFRMTKAVYTAEAWARDTIEIEGERIIR